MREYFGEHTAFFFAFLGFSAWWMLAPAVVGLAVFTHQIVVANPAVSYLPAFAIFISLWSCLFCEFWKREQARLAQRWGVVGYTKEEPLRPEYVRASLRVRSPIDGRPTYYFSPASSAYRSTVSGMVTATLLALVVIVGSILILRGVLVTLQGTAVPDNSAIPISSILNSIQIAVLNLLYRGLALLLTW